MSELIRTMAPGTHSIEKIPFFFPDSVKMDNGTDVFFYNDVDAEVVKIELLFNAGTAYGETPLLARMTNSMITAGTSTLSQKQIAEMIDSYGAYFEKEISADHASLTVYSLRKYAEEVLKIITEVFNDCVFPEVELQNNLRVQRQKFLINQEKVSFLCKQKFTRLLFGDHPYGRKTELNNYDTLRRKDVQSFYTEHYKKRPTFLLAGKVDEKLIKCLNKLFGSQHYEVEEPESASNGIKPVRKREILLKEDAIQSAIRIGRLLFSKTHPDYPGMYVLNTILGGYFGSRLMSNLREDKGYTYGVGSGISSMKDAGYFFISTEVGAEVTAAAEKEILFEIDRLRQDKVPLQELEVVKNYILGQLLQHTDGVFELLDQFKSLHIFGLSESHFHQNIGNLKAVNPDLLIDLAQKYFDVAEFTTVIAGKVQG